MANTAAQLFVEENRFYGRAAFALAVLITIGFAAFNLLGITDITVMPLSTHLHGVVMTAWLLLFLTQNILGAGRKLPLHRKLGWLGAALVPIIVVTAWNTGVVTLAANRTPPAFDPAYFLALNFVQPVIFAALVYYAIANRKRTDWHRRLMLGSLIVIAEPALGRLVLIFAVPILGGPENAIPLFASKPWLLPLIELGIQVLILGFIMWRDKAMRGSVHPALKLSFVALIATYVLIALLAVIPAFTEKAMSLKGSAL